MAGINLGNMREMDYVLTTNRKPLANIIRARSAGVRHTFDVTKATHAGIIIDISSGMGGDFVILEMVPVCISDILTTGYKKSGMQITPIKDYQNQGWFGDRIVCFRRNPVYDSEALRIKANERAIDDFIATSGYDTKELLRFIFRKIPEVKNQYYCSELIQHYAMLDGGKIQGGDGDNITPYGIQIAKNLIG